MLRGLHLAAVYAKYRSVGRMNASNLISSKLTPKIMRAYQITIKLKALYSSVRALNSARLIGYFLSITVGRELTGQGIL